MRRAREKPRRTGAGPPEGAKTCTQLTGEKSRGSRKVAVVHKPSHRVMAEAAER